MKWQKRGLVYAPRGDRWWAKSYATIPTVDILDERVIRVYFASLDENHFGRIGYVDLDAQDPTKILFETPEPVLDIGAPGSFDDSGVNAACIIPVHDKKYLYYIGWQRCEQVPYMLFSGLAISSDGGTRFEKYAPVPILDRTPAEPFSRSAPFVLAEQDRFHVWYWSCEYWSKEESLIHYNNVIRHALSVDGIHWENSQVCLSPQTPEDYSVGRPWVIHEMGTFKMWYSIRGKGRIPYRIGYAESPDGLVWIRQDERVGIECSETGWDSEMLCYPCVVDVLGKRYMFYNGNRHGSTGFGFAELVS
jgi:hypothetical protein